MEIKIIGDNTISRGGATFYTVVCNGETLLECMSKDELRSLTIGGIEDAYEETKRMWEEFADALTT